MASIKPRLDPFPPSAFLTSGSPGISEDSEAHYPKDGVKRISIDLVSFEGRVERSGENMWDFVPRELLKVVRTVRFCKYACSTGSVHDMQLFSPDKDTPDA